MRRALLAALTLALGAPATAAAAPERVTVTPHGGPMTGSVWLGEQQAASDDGERVVFASTANNLDPADTDTERDVFVWDRSENTVRLVSQSTDGVAGNAMSWDPAISADGTRVVFSSQATNLVSGDTNSRNDVFVRDIDEGTTELVSVSPAGPSAGGQFTGNAVINGDGTVVAFESEHDYAAGTWMWSNEVWVRDLAAGTTTIVSSPTQVYGSYEPSISRDGRFVTYGSSDPDAGDPWGVHDIFLRDRQTGDLEVVSVGDDESFGDSGADSWSSVSADGRFVAFASNARNLVEGDTNYEMDVFVRDRQAGTTERVSVAGLSREADDPSRQPQISEDGRFVSFTSRANTLDPGGVQGGNFGGYVRDRLRKTTRSLRRLALNEDWQSSDEHVQFAMAPAGQVFVASAWNSNDLDEDEAYRFDLPASNDVTPPALHLPDRVAAEATNGAGAYVKFSPKATDETGAADVACKPESGAFFAMDETTVDCIAVDEAGNERTGSFDVDVDDTTAPSLTMPERIAIDANSPGGGSVFDDFHVTAHDAVDDDVDLVCDPAEGSRLPVGIHTVTCTGTDDAGNARSKSMVVEVREVSPTPNLAVSDIRVPENIGDAIIEVGLNPAPPDFLKFEMQPVDGTAERNRDFGPPWSGSVYATGNRAYASIHIVDDERDEADEETFTVRWGPFTYPEISTITIVDDDGPRENRRGVENGSFVAASDLGGLHVQDGDQSWRIGDGLTLRDPHVSPDGKEVVYVSGDVGGVIRRRALDGGGEITELTEAREDVPSNPVWRPDGRAVAYVRDTDWYGGSCADWGEDGRPPSPHVKREIAITGVDGESGDPKTLDVPCGWSIRDLSWGPDGFALAFDVFNENTKSWDIGIIESDSGEIRMVTETAGVDERRPSWAPDGSRIAYERDGRIATRTPEGDDERVLPAAGPGVTDHEPAFSPDSHRLLIRREIPGETAEDDRLTTLVTTDLTGGDVQHAYPTGIAEGYKLRNADWGAADRGAPSSAGRVLFTRRGTGAEVRAVRADGSSERAVSATGDDSAARTSADGTTVALASTRDHAEPEIYLVTPGGRAPRRITDNDVREGGPAPSPDGSRVVFWRAGASAGESDLFVANADGSGERRLTDAAGGEVEPVFAHDGTKVAYATLGDDPTVRIVGADGTGDHAVTEGRQPAFSADDTMIAFVRDDAQGVPQVWTAAADGTGVAQVTFGSGGARNPSFSPDGKAIAYATANGIAKAHVDGTGPVALTSNPADGEPEWAKDAPLPKLTVADVEVEEAAGKATFALELSRVPDDEVTVAVATDERTAVAPEDFTATAKTVTFAPGERTQQVDVPVAADALDEPDERFALLLSSASGATLAAADEEAIALVRDDDPAPSLTVSDVELDEGDDVDPRSMTFTLALGAVSGWDVTFRAATGGGTATPGVDYLAVDRAVTIPAGQTSVTVDVPVLGDPADEEDETLTLTLSDGQHVVLPATQPTGTIRDDDATGGEAPETKVAKAPGAFTNDSTPTFDFESSLRVDPVFECRVDGGSWARCTTPFTARLLRDGAHVFEVRSFNGTLVDESPDRIAFTVDTVAPSTTITTAPKAVTTDKRPLFVLAADEADVRLECAMDAAAAVACEPRVRPDRDLRDGDHVFTARAIDRAGNADPTPATHRFRVDTTPPDTRFADEDAAQGGSGDAFSDQQGPAATVGGTSRGSTYTLSDTGTAMIPVSCPASADRACEGEIALSVAPAARAAVARARVAASAFARERFRVAPGQTLRVAVSLPRSIRARIERAGRLAVATTVTPTGGAPTTRSMTLTADPRLPRLLQAGLRVAVKGRSVALRLHCPLKGGCRGTVELLAGDRPLGRVRLALPGRRTRTVRVGLTAAARARIRAAANRTLPVTAVLRTGSITRSSTSATPRTKRVDLTLTQTGGRR